MNDEGRDIDLAAAIGFMVFTVIVLVIALVVLGGCASTRVPVPAARPAPVVSGLTHYPRRMFRVTARGDGSPMLRGGAIDSVACAKIARYDIVSIYAPPLVARPDIVAYLKSLNPSLTILATLPGGVWENPHPAIGDTTTDLAWARWRVIRDHNAFLYGTDGRWLADDDNVDRANHLAAIALATVDAHAADRVDGLWLDTICLGEGWRESALDSIDWRRSGYECRADWERAYAVGHRIYVEALRRASGPNALLVGNCGPEGEQDALNGWMREGFPFQNGGSWNTNMLGFDGHPGYLTENYVTPHLSVLAGFCSGNAYADSVQMVFGLASATLGDGAWEQDAAGVNVAVPYYWPREFDISLGIPRGSAFQNSDSTWRRDFSGGFAEVNVYRRTGKVVAR